MIHGILVIKNVSYRYVLFYSYYEIVLQWLLYIFRNLTERMDRIDGNFHKRKNQDFLLKKLIMFFNKEYDKVPLGPNKRKMIHTIVADQKRIIMIRFISANHKINSISNNRKILFYIKEKDKFVHQGKTNYFYNFLQKELIQFSTKGINTIFYKKN